MFSRASDGTAYEFIGSTDNPTLVLIHGLGLCRNLWEPFLPELSRDFSILIYDLHGHGNSTPVPKTTNLTVYANQIKLLLDHLNIPEATLVGFSIGGMINRRFAMMFPETTRALAILNSPHNRGKEAQIQVEERANSVRIQGPTATLDEALKRWFTPEFLDEKEDYKKVCQWRELVDPESYAQAAWVLANGVRELIAPEPPIQCPTLVLTSENDTGSTPKMSRDIAGEISGSELIIVPNLRHLGLMENPDLFCNHLVRFLNQNTL
ncbi:MAG: alpha/beta fold hydrolase [Pseudomonadota bacterium]